MNSSLPCSPTKQVGGIFYFARMLDKIRLHAKGELPEAYLANLGNGFDGRCTAFLGIAYHDLEARVKQGGTDSELLEWCFTSGTRRSEGEIEVWNDFMRKRGWNDEAAEILKRRKAEGGYTDRADIVTMFNYIDADEGRTPAGIEF